LNHTSVKISSLTIPYPPDDSDVSSRQPPPNNAPIFYAKRSDADKQGTIYEGDLAYILFYHSYAP
jgi:hypothetical protein